MWTLARLELLEGYDDAALEHCLEIVRRWEESDDRHYSVNALGWVARCSPPAVARSCTAP